MSAAIPTFAVVGRVNEGKSSIVATLTESDDVIVGPEPGTTRDCRTFTIGAAGLDLVRVIDTPGFQEPEAAWAWIEERHGQLGGGAETRERAVREFVVAFGGDERFTDECRLLRPILDGAFILYVVDASHPYRRGYELEMRILRWTGRPQIALINRTGTEDYSAAWLPPLRQYFHAVRAFNAHAASHLDRDGLLAILSELDEALKQPLSQARDILQADRQQRRDRALDAICGLLEEALTQRAVKYDARLPLSDREQEELRRKLRDSLRLLEERERNTVEALYRFRRTPRAADGDAFEEYSRDLFAAETYRVFGLSTSQLMGLGVAAGAGAGLAVDVGTGGLTHGAGTAVGAITGAALTFAMAWRKPELTLGPMNASGTNVELGPVSHPNFPWVLLGRALAHFHHVADRAHARRDPLPADAIRPVFSKDLKRLFDKLAKSSLDADGRRELRACVDEFLGPPTSAS